MNLRFYRKTAVLGGILLGAMSLLGTSVFAAQHVEERAEQHDANSRKQPGGHLNINEVFVSFGTPETLTIKGDDFNFGRHLVVTLGNAGRLNIVSASETEIVANCPLDLNKTPNCVSGDYLLTVSTGTGQSQNDEYDLTIGAVGPKGPQGEKGSEGAVGPQGIAGTAGPQGEKGDVGSIGPQGIVGSEGPQGPQGSVGPTGPKGTMGEPGLNCWDSNGDGFPDQIEDVNDDGLWDTLDCKAPSNDNIWREITSSTDTSDFKCNCEYYVRFGFLNAPRVIFMNFNGKGATGYPGVTSCMSADISGGTNFRVENTAKDIVKYRVNISTYALPARVFERCYSELPDCE